VAREFLYTRWVELANPAYRLGGTSNTFHGRDIFAPAAAHVAGGVPIEALGSPVESAVMLPAPRLGIEPHRVTGEIMHIDHFGSAVTSIGLLSWDTPERLTLKSRSSDAPPLTFAANAATLRVDDHSIAAIRHTYSDVEPGAELALVGSSGYLELSVNGGSFAERFGANIGDSVELQIG
jgi:S-adenosylmethionine hydrolase